MPHGMAPCPSHSHIHTHAPSKAHDPHSPRPRVTHAQVTGGNTIVEVKPQGVSKGGVVERILSGVAAAAAYTHGTGRLPVAYHYISLHIMKRLCVSVCMVPQCSVSCSRLGMWVRGGAGGMALRGGRGCLLLACSRPGVCHQVECVRQSPLLHCARTSATHQPTTTYHAQVPKPRMQPAAQAAASSRHPRAQTARPPRRHAASPGRTPAAPAAAARPSARAAAAAAPWAWRCWQRWRARRAPRPLTLCLPLGTTAAMRTCLWRLSRMQTRRKTRQRCGLCGWKGWRVAARFQGATRPQPLHSTPKKPLAHGDQPWRAPLLSPAHRCLRAWWARSQARRPTT